MKRSALPLVRGVVGAGAFVAQREGVAAFAELLRYEGRAVVGQNPLHSDVLLCEPRDGIAEERAGGSSASNSTYDSRDASSTATNANSNPCFFDPNDRLRVMRWPTRSKRPSQFVSMWQQLSGLVSFVPDRRSLRLGDSAAGSGLLSGRSGPRSRGCTVGLRCLSHRPSLSGHSFVEQLSTCWAGSRILVHVHPGPSCQPVRFEGFQIDESRPDEQPASRNNVLAHHSWPADASAADVGSASFSVKPNRWRMTSARASIFALSSTMRA